MANIHLKPFYQSMFSFFFNLLQYNLFLFSQLFPLNYTNFLVETHAIFFLKPLRLSSLVTCDFEGIRLLFILILFGLKLLDKNLYRRELLVAVIQYR